MRSRMLYVNWGGLDGASGCKKILHLRPNDAGKYACPVDECLHSDFASQRGLRKHINNKHTWYYYFDRRPEVKREELVEVNDDDEPHVKQPVARVKLSRQSGFGLELYNWLHNPSGGDKSQKDAAAITTRALAYFEHCMGDCIETDLTVRFVNYCLGSANHIMEFMEAVRTERKVGSSCALTYAKALSDVIDFQKIQGVTDSTLRSYAITEVYLRRIKGNLARRKRVEYGRNLDVEQLIARDSWASVDEMEKVIPYHTPEYMELVKKCSDSEQHPTLTELAFGYRYVVTFLFLRVKCSRPMTFRALTLDMFEGAKKNGGYIDQTEFKTQAEYIFDTLVLTPAVINIIQTYVDFIRPRCHPVCDFLLVNTRGKQSHNLARDMTRMTYEAISKHVNPTRWRQVIETESSIVLDDKEQEVVSKDQKHSSTVAKRAYIKRKSRDVANESRQALKKIRGTSGDKHDHLMSSQFQVLRAVSDSSKQASEQLEDDKVENEGEAVDTLVIQPIDIANPNSPVITITSEAENDPVTVGVECVEVADKGEYSVEVKKEDARNASRGYPNVKFTTEEDHFLSAGVKRFGPSNWSKVLTCPDYKFHPSRTRDSLRMRAKTKKMVPAKKST